MSSKLRSLMIQLRDDQIARLDQQAGATGASRSKALRDALDTALDAGVDASVATRYASAFTPKGTPPAGHPCGQGPSWAELWWCEAPGAPAGAVLVLSRPEAVQHLPRLLVARTAATGHGLPSEVALDENDGLAPCVVALDLPEAVERGSLTRRLGVLSAHRWQQVAEALRGAVNA